MHYERLIARAKCRSLVGYTERHHVLPKCMGGSNDPENLVQLTAEEHFVAHQLLHKIYPHVSGLAFAMISMSWNEYGHRSNKVYGWIKRKNAIAVSVAHKEIWKRPGYREHMRQALARVHERPGHREKMSSLRKGRVKSAQERANIAAARRVASPRKFSDEAKANMAAARRKTWAERKASGEDKKIAAKIKATRSKNGTYEFTDEHKAAIGRSGKGRVVTPEQRAAISERMKAYRAAQRAMKLQ